MKTDYNECKEAKIERFQELAAKNENLSTSLFNESTKMANFIPFGQPIMVGHHSERGDRNFRAKIHNKMRKSAETDKKAKYYEARAETLLNGTAISSDNPNAIELLNDKLEKLEALQTLYKSINKIAGSKKCAYGIPSFTITNNGAKIRNTKQRIEYLAKIEATKTTEEEINGAILKINSEANRVQIIFPSIPSPEIRTSLKRSGFHWSPREGVWMRQISNSAIWAAKDILNKLAIDNNI